MKQGLRATVALALGALVVEPTFAHGGGLNAQGCHNDRKNGGYHCHRSQNNTGTYRLYSAPRKKKVALKIKRKGKVITTREFFRFVGGSTYYSNCSAARAAGVAPIRAGNPGYGRHLDRDGDGVACE